MSVPPPVVHTFPRVDDTIYHFEPSEGSYVYEKMDEMKDQFLELRKELKTLRGKDFFGKSYKYNVDIATDRDQLRSMCQKDKETFKEYAQRWRQLAAYPPLEEKEMTKIFLKTLSSFYYELMITSAPNDFTEMVNMGMRIEERVCKGRLTKEEASTSKKYNVKDMFPIAKIDELLDELSTTSIFNKIDLRSGYHQIIVALEDIDKTALLSFEIHYEFLVMSFEITNALSIFQLAMKDLPDPYLR
ncbi:uncharacterized protein LOC127131344 [Lathyrus oleraceus]|uniref:uncharacterized protein LOC127131344 n=1 Tax=Pisum sativum TaxID=3888 RepID=UPI0021D1FE74|nr:uncharacterized protein LOC127131344 [Pisum sativum]